MSNLNMWDPEQFIDETEQEVHDRLNEKSYIPLNLFSLHEFQKVETKHVSISIGKKEYTTVCMSYKSGYEKHCVPVIEKTTDKSITTQVTVTRWYDLPKDELDELKVILQKELSEFLFVLCIREVVAKDYENGAMKLCYQIRGVKSPFFDVKQEPGVRS